MGWTKSQETAITDRGRSLLLSAGAGSGKTTVLAERLTNMLIEGGTLDNFLVVTFTNAAAGDLKEKLYKKLSEAVAKHPGDKRLYSQLFRLSGAQISTIHSFCFGLIRQNFNKTGLPPTCYIGEQSECFTLMNDAISELKDDRFSNEGDEIYILAENFCKDLSDDGIDDILKNVYDKIRAFYHYEEWLSQCERKYITECEKLEKGFFETECGAIIQEELAFMLRQQLDAAERLCHTVAMHGTEKNMKGCESLYEYIDLLLSSCDSYEKFLSAVGSVKIESANCKSLDESIAEYYKKTKLAITKRIKTISEQVNFGTPSEIEAVFCKCRAVASAFKTVLLDLDRRFSEKKRSRGMLDYADLEQYTMRLLENPDGSESDLCLKLKERYTQVFIDEYQDVNPLQDKIFSFISRDANRFTVGDVKQSIYRFRNAYPDIFLGYKKEYSDPTVEKNAAVFLRENFRCDRTVVDFVNTVTEYASQNGRSAPEYAGESLIFQKDAESCKNKPACVAYSFYESGEKEKARGENADFVASEIKRLVNECGYKYSDIALLFSAVTGYTAPYENLFRACGIPYDIVGNEDCIKTPEVTLALCSLKAIDNPTDDISLFSMMRSPIYGFSADELYKIRNKNDAYLLFTCLKRFAAGSHLKPVSIKSGVYKLEKKAENPKRLELKIKKFLKEFDALREEALGSSSHKFLWSFYIKSGLLSFAEAGDDGARRKENLLALYERAASFERNGFKGVSAFCEYMRRVEEDGGKMEIPGELKGDGVRLMSIHKSKGLEFPVCFVVNADREFNCREQGDSLILDRMLGISFRLQDEEKHIKYDTPSRVAASRKLQRASVSEELRKLYVALTRAKNIIYVVGAIKSDYFDYDSDPVDANCFMDWVIGACRDKKSKDINMFEIGKTSPFAYRTAPNKAAKKVPKGLDKAISFVYPYCGYEKIPAKVSVSQLRKGLLEEEEYTKEPVRVSFKTPVFAGETVYAGNDVGTANHIFMQFCDMENAYSAGSLAEGKRLLERRFITSEQLEMLDFEKLDNFFKGSLYAEMRDAEQIFREKRFSISDSASLLGGDEKEKILIQGVIDCFFIAKDGSVTVVDYKTDRVGGKDAEKILLERHSAQLGYYCRAVSKMTNRKVKRGLIYSFALGRAVELK